MDEIYGVDENGYIVAEEEETEIAEESQGVDLEGEVPETVGEIGDSADPLWPFFFDSALEEPSVTVVPYDPAADSDSGVALLAADVYKLDGMVVYTLNLSSYGACYVVLTPEQADNVTLEAGQLINWSSANITVPLYRSEPADRPAVQSLMLTLLGRGSTSFPSNYYRYGTCQYVTSYYVNGSTLSSTQSYVSMSAADQVGYSRQYWLWVVVVVCLLIMAVNGLIRFLRRGHRG